MQAQAHAPVVPSSTSNTQQHETSMLIPPPLLCHQYPPYHPPHTHTHRPGSPAYAIEATLLAIFLGDMASSFFVARYDKGVLIGDRNTLIKIYLRFR
jgi:hypothetical protein